MTNLDSILKRRDITLPKNFCLVKAMVFPVVMYGCESWTIKKAECWRTDAFELWCWRRLLRVPWTAKRFNQSRNQSWIFIGRTNAEASTPILGHLIWRTDSFEKTLMLERLKGGEGDSRGWDGWMASLTQWTWVWVSSRSWWWTGSLSWHAAVYGVSELDTTVWLNWTELNCPHFSNKTLISWKVPPIFMGLQIMFHLCYK